MSSSPDGIPVRDAATVILVRRRPDGPEVLMGKRGAGAAFMASKFVFPGGALDADDLALADLAPDLALAPPPLLAVETAPRVARALPLAAVRELWEETGLMLGRPDPAAAARDVPPGWRGFFAAGLVPNPAALTLVFRAVTPPGRPRRFDARFFLAEASSLAVEDTIPSGEELSDLAWLDLAAARALDLPFITELVLGELAEMLAAPALDPARPVPFFRHGADGPRYRLLAP